MSSEGMISRPPLLTKKRWIHADKGSTPRGRTTMHNSTLRATSKKQTDKRTQRGTTRHCERHMWNELANTKQEAHIAKKNEVDPNTLYEHRKNGAWHCKRHLGTAISLVHCPMRHANAAALAIGFDLRLEPASIIPFVIIEIRKPPLELQHLLK